MLSPLGLFARYLPSTRPLRLVMGRFMPRRSMPKRSTIRWHVLLMPLCFIPIVTYWIIGPTYIANVPTFVFATVLNFSLAGGCVLTLDYLTQRIVHQYPNLNQTGSRVWRSFVVFLIVTPLFLGGGIFLYSHFALFGYQHSPGLTAQILFYNVGVNVLSVGIDETVYSLTKLREMTIEREELKKVNLQSQYESLKHQVNPHFLFNSLNSLSSLIADEPQQAEQFVAEMAKVYRYLLQTNSRRSDTSVADTVTANNDGELTTLETELQFIQSYYHLLKTRYRAGIELKVDVSPAYQDYRLPPLTLQMLVENAVKHNIISATKPLLLEIMIAPDSVGLNTRELFDRLGYSEPGHDRPGHERLAYGRPGSSRSAYVRPVQLLVRNNLQRKTTRVLSNQIGLTNIAAKYRLLGQTEPLVRDDDGYFSVVLPLFLP